MKSINISTFAQYTLGDIVSTEPAEYSGGCKAARALNRFINVILARINLIGLKKKKHIINITDTCNLHYTMRYKKRKAEISPCLQFIVLELTRHHCDQS